MGHIIYANLFSYLSFLCFLSFSIAINKSQVLLNSLKPNLFFIDQ